MPENAPDDAPKDTPEQDGAKPDEQLGDGGKAALAAERKARNEAEKARKALEAELQKLRDKDLTEAERVANEAKAATARAEAAEARALRLEVAAAKGIDLALAPRLVGATREELEADAEQFKALLPAQKPDDGKITRLQPDRGQGAKPNPAKGGYDAGAARARAKFGTPTGGDAA